MLILAVATACLVCIAIIGFFIGLGQIISTRDSVKDRLGAFAPLPATGSTEAETGQEKKPKRLARRLNRFISGQAFASSLKTALARANLPLTVQEYTLINIACVCVLFLLALALSRQLILALIGAIVGFFLPGLYLSRRQRQRLVAFQGQLPDVLTLLVGSLRSGYGMTIAMDTVSTQMPPPVSEEFGRVVREVGLGVSTGQALSNLVRRIRSDDLDLVVTAIAIQYEVGGNLATILEAISDTITERVRLKGQLRTLTIQHTMTRYVLTALPVGLGLILYILNPKYMGGLFMPGPTLLIPIGAAVLLVMGYLVMSKLGTIDV